MTTARSWRGPLNQLCPGTVVEAGFWSWLHAGMRIRDARPDELHTVGEVRLAAYLADGFLSADSAYTPRLRALGADGDGYVLVAVEEDADGTGRGEVLGTVMIRSWPGGDLLQTADEAEVRALAVAPYARGLGIGRKLVSAVIEHAGDRVIVEASPRDRIWGIGLAAGDERAMSPEQWPGLNLLGFALMEVRHRLQAQLRT